MVILSIAGGALRAADWPQWLGPLRNGVSLETNLVAAFPKDGPRVLWRKEVGQGWSSPVVASNRVLIFHREGDMDVLECLNATNGAAAWKSGVPTQYRDDFGFDEGPRATPAISGNRVFTFSAEGALAGFDFNAGRELWRVETRKDFEIARGYFGVAASPLVAGDLVILNVGGANGAGVVAFDAASGEVRWKATGQPAGHSSAVPATLGGKETVLVLGRSALVALEAANGRVLWEHPFRPRIQASVSAATPLVFPDRGGGKRIFISASYGAGAALLRADASRAEVIWRGDDILSNHYATSVERGGFLFGFDGRQEQRCNLRCVELGTGKVRWNEDRFGGGTVLSCGERLVILTEGGELILSPATPEKFNPTARAQILGSDCRAAPALANGFLYARDKRQLICVDLRAR
jgi:outer membrane protein assembly factor BamB